MKTKLLTTTAILLGVFLLRWHLVQWLAWATMFARYATTHGVRDGWTMTFDGQHPCLLCHLVASGTQAEAWLFGMLFANPSLLLAPAACLAALPIIHHLLRQPARES